MGQPVLSAEGFGDKLYNKMPAVYKREDEKVKYALQRYYQAIGEGFKPIIEDTNKLLTFYNPEEVDTAILPYIFRSFGFPVFNGIPELYLRNLLPMVGDLFERKGTFEVIEYITSVVTDTRVHVTAVAGGGGTAYFGEALFGSAIFGNTSGIGVVEIIVTISIQIEYGSYVKDVPSEEQLRKIIKNFVPFFAHVTVIFQYEYADAIKVKVKEEGWSDRILWKNGDVLEVYGTDSGVVNLFNQKYKDSKLISRLAELFIDFGLEESVLDNKTDSELIEIIENGFKQLVDTKPVEESNNVLINEDRNDIIRFNIISNRANVINDGYLPKGSAIFGTGQPMGMMVFGTNKPYTTVDYTVDKITYESSGDTEIKVIG